MQSNLATKIYWFIKSSLGLDIGFFRVSSWTISQKLEFLIKKYREIFLLSTRLKKFKLGESHLTLFGKPVYYDSPYGIAGYQSMLTRHQKAIKFARISHVKTIVDVGANVGFFSMMLKSLYPKAKFYAIEPVPQIFDCLKKNVIDQNAKVFNLALSDTAGNLKMNFNEYESAFSHVVTDSDKKTKCNIQIPSKTLDQFCKENNIKTIDILKIDTESFEAHVLRGAQEILKKTRYLSIEISVENNPNYTFSQINHLLYSKDHNFQLLYFRNYTDKGSGPIPVGDFLYKNETFKR